MLQDFYRIAISRKFRNQGFVARGQDIVLRRDDALSSHLISTVIFINGIRAESLGALVEPTYQTSLDS